MPPPSCAPLFRREHSAMMRSCPSCALVVGVAAWSLSAMCAAVPAKDSGLPQSGSSTTTPNAVVQSQEQTNSLEPGKPVVRTLTGAETHQYQLRLQKGQCGVIRVEQRGVNVVVQLLGSANVPEVEVDDEIGKQGTEKLDIVADKDGSYTVAVKPKLKRASGAYEIRLVEIRAATDQDRTLYEVRHLRTKAHQLLDEDKWREALPLAEQALALAQGVLGPEDVYVAILKRERIRIDYLNGDMPASSVGLEQSLQVLTAKLGPDHPQTILTERGLGYLYTNLENFSKADQLLIQALESAERTLGRDDPVLAGILDNLGVMHLHLADYASAEREFQRGLAILEDAGLTEERQYAYLLTNEAILYIIQRKLDKAEASLQRVLAVFEKKLGPDSLKVSDILANLGVVAKKKKDYPAAEKYYGHSLAIREKYFGPEDNSYIATLSNLGNVYSSEGNYQKALQTHLRALSLLEKTSSPIVSRRMELEDIAGNYTALGDFENAIRTQSRLQETLESETALKLTIGSERQKLAYLNSVASDMDDTISLHLQFQPDNAQATATAATALLRRKGRVLDAMTDSLGALRKRSDPADQALLDQLKEAGTGLARVALKGPDKQSADEYRKTLDDLKQKKEKLENAISHHHEDFRAQLQPVTLEAVLSAIPPDSALVEFVTYRPSNPKAPSGAEQYGDLRYAAYVMHRDASPRGIDLGDANAINTAVEKLRAALREPNRSDAKQLAQTVSEKVFHPLQSLVADDKRLLVSPDGQLDLIPFEALVDDQERFLVERFSITYLTTGRDLLRMRVPRPSRSAPVLVADPLFGEPNDTLVASAAISQATPANPRAARRSVTTATNFSNLYFAPLDGTRAEARSIQALFPEARVLAGEQASESALEQLNAPRILHIATHGFFLQDTSQNGAGGAPGTAATEPENPLLRSGLALSGANRVKDGKGEGILTALEASNLNLWGTKLVTLSACDTGVGEVKDREGVYGLRRSFFLAGAETLVMSLWPVSDYVTREMMTAS